MTNYYIFSYTNGASDIHIYIYGICRHLLTFIILNFSCVFSIGVDCLLIIVMCYSYFITCLHGFLFRTFRYDLYINRIADSFHLVDIHL